MGPMGKGLALVCAVLLAPGSTIAYGAGEQSLEREVVHAEQVGKAAPGKGNWVAVPIPVSNPTVGTGLQGVLMYLHPKKPGNEQAPNTTSGIATMYTDTHSWLVGGFHDASWANDQYRFTGIAGYGHFNLSYYGVGNNPALAKHPLAYSFSAALARAQLQVRVPGTRHWFVGAHYLFADGDVVFETGQLMPGLPDARGSVRIGGLGLLTTYDSRNNNYYPTRGEYFQARWTDYGQTWGSDFSYRKLRIFFNHYQPLGARTVLALRADLQTSTVAPFFDLPYLDLRGYSRDRYRDRNTLSVHAEGRYKFRPRWGVVGFAEAGWYGKRLADLRDNPTIVSYGMGLRWQVTKDKALNLGLDLAFTNDGNVLLVEVGEKF